MSKYTIRKTFAAVSVATLSVMVAPMAFAVEDAATTFTEPVSPSSIPEQANLTVHKLTPSTAGGVKHNGTKLDALPAGSEPIEGVTFTAYRIEGINLATNEGWRTASNIAADWNALAVNKKNEAIAAGKLVVGGQTYTLTQAQSAKTGQDGNAKFENLTTALYVVQETLTGDVTVDGKSYPAASVVKAAPFVVALPMTDAQNTAQWRTDVHVYPKNSLSEKPTKTVEDSTNNGSNNTGDNAVINTYTITADIPDGLVGPTQNNPEKKTVLRNFQMIDQLDERLEWQPEANKITLAGQEMDKGDYTIEQSTKTYTTADGRKVHLVVVTFTDQGLNKLASAAKDAKVVWQLKGRVLDMGDVTTNIPNEASVIPDFPNNGDTKFDPNNPDPENPDEPKIPGDPTDKVVTYYGNVELTKVDANTDTKKLAGAEFEVYACNKNAELQGSAIYVGDKKTFVTGQEGNLVIKGLHVNDWRDNKAVSAEDSFYCLKETKAPEGYELLPNVVQFQLLKSEEANNKVIKKLTVKNVPSNGGFDLPLTGGKGVVPLIALGGLLVVGAIGYAGYASRRRENA